MLFLSALSKVLCLEIDSIKFSISFVLIQNKVVRKRYRPISLPYFLKLRTALWITAIHPINQELLLQSTSSFSLARAFYSVHGIKSRKVWEKVLFSSRHEEQILINGFPSIGKNKTRPVNECASDHIVIQLMRTHLNEGKNVTANNYLTSVRLATQLKKKQTSVLGTVNKVRQKVPLSLRKMKEELYSCKLYKCGIITLTAYQEKVNKHVLILSTTHKHITTADNAKKTKETV